MTEQNLDYNINYPTISLHVRPFPSKRPMGEEVKEWSEGIVEKFHEECYRNTSWKLLSKSTQCTPAACGDFYDCVLRFQRAAQAKEAFAHFDGFAFVIGTTSFKCQVFYSKVVCSIFRKFITILLMC